MALVVDRDTPVTYGDINDAVTAILAAQLIMVGLFLVGLLVHHLYWKYWSR